MQGRSFFGQILAALILAGATSQSFAQFDGWEAKSFQIVRTDTPPVIDGQLDDDVWSTAAVVRDLHQMDPIEYNIATQETEIFVLYDQDALYVGARMWDTEPDRITANVLRQGASIGNDDQLILIIDPYNNGRDGYQFLVNPNGVRSEGIYVGSTQLQQNWEGIWRASATRDDQGWIAEVEIPFKTLSFDPATDSWGINFGRRAQSRNERMAWVSRNRSQNPAVSGQAIGIDRLDQGTGLDIVPSVSVSEMKDFSMSSNDSELDPSLDIFYRLTPSLSGSLTFNTDFSATEVDDRQVNLTRFSLFFPEKRDFFLRDADIFEFGGTGAIGNFTQLSRTLEQNSRPFFSRRIGLNRGQPVDLKYGGKLSGRVGPWNLGAIAITQDAFGNVDETNLFTGRATLNVLDESNVGVIMTDGDPQSNLGNRVVGVDFNYLNTTLPNGRAIRGSAWYQQSDTEGLTGDDTAWGVRIIFPSTQGIRYNAAIKEIEANFNPAQGFVNRAGIRDTAGELGYVWRYGNDSLFRTIFTLFGLQRVESLATGKLQSERLDARVISFNTQAGDQIRLLYTDTREVLDEPFGIWDPDPISGDLPVTIPVGDYSFDDVGVEFNSEDARKVSGTVRYRTGDFYTGTKDTFETDLTWTPSINWRFFLSYAHNDIQLPEGDFDLRLSRVGIDYVFSNRLSWVNLLQYDNDSEVIGINSRLHWIPEAGREAFIVLNHNLRDLDRNDSFHSTLADISIKFSYTFRF